MKTTKAQQRHEGNEGHDLGLRAFAWCFGAFMVGHLTAAPAWNVPKVLPFGELSVVEIREDDPTQPPLPRPGDDKLGPLDLRSVEPTADGRGWKLTVQPMIPGTVLVPPVNFGDGRQSPELRVAVPRTVPYQGPWMGVGGGQGDVIPYIPFPWAWASLLLLPVIALMVWLWRRWRRGAAGRARHHARSAFIHHWPPKALDRETLDQAHALGRNLLAAHFGEEARSWGLREFRERSLDAWAVWTQSLDAARFARKEPPFPPLAELLKLLEHRP